MNDKNQAALPIIPLLQTEVKPDSLTDEELFEEVALQGALFRIDTINWPDFPYAPKVSARLAHDGSRLYILYDVTEKNLRVAALDDNGPVWEDSCVEFFVADPDGRHYYNFETNAAGTALASKRLSREDCRHFNPEQMARILRRPTIARRAVDFSDECGVRWELLVAVPFSLMGFDATPLRLRINLYKCGDRTATPHFLSWAPIQTPAPDFHRPEFFREVQLELPADNGGHEAIARAFSIPCPILEVRKMGEGFINDTLLVVTPEGFCNYILQRKNRNVFPEVPEMMENIRKVTAWLREATVADGGDPGREVLTQIPLRGSDRLYYVDGNGEYWTVCEFIEGSVTHDRVTTPELAFEGGRGIGRFHRLLTGFTSPLHETIRGFHNLRLRFEQWDEAVAADRAGRCASLTEEIGWIEERREEIMRFQQMIEQGVFPIRVTHNDTKISNILFDADNRALCVIDLDTMMNATVFNDFGDAIRSYTNTGAEDDPDLSRVSCSVEFFEAYARGFLSECRDMLTEAELEWLPYAGRFITFEQVLRFLMDYINGDTYYKIAYPEHNLVRTRAQFALLRSMEEQYPRLKQAVAAALK